MSEKKYPQLSLTQDTYRELEDLKVELGKKSFNQVLKALIDEHKVKEECVTV